MTMVEFFNNTIALEWKSFFEELVFTHKRNLNKCQDLYNKLQSKFQF